MSRAKRIDDTQRQIVNHLRAIGWFVHVAADLGGGFPDLVVAHERTRQIALVECKTGKRGLNDIQRKFRDAFPGPMFVVRSPDDAEKQLTLWLLTTVAWKK